MQLDDLVVELGAPGARHNDVGLLLLAVAMPHGRAVADRALDAAMLAVQAEVRITRRRTRLSEAMQDALRRAIDDAEEAEIDEHVADNWKAS